MRISYDVSEMIGWGDGLDLELTTIRVSEDDNRVVLIRNIDWWG